MERQGPIRLDAREALPEALRGAIVALGNFDGFHLGHQAVVGRAVERARAEGRPALVATFDPHPMRFFKPDTPWFRLTTLEQRAELMQQAGADALLVFTFDAALAAESAEAFVRSRLLEQIGAAGVVTGADFTFGKGRSGDVGGLAALGQELGFSTDTVGAGIYAVRVTLEDGRVVDGAANLGIRPSFDPPKELLEPYLFDFSGDLYGQTIDVALIDYLRPEAKFDSLEALKAQMAADCDRARELLAR